MKLRASALVAALLLLTPAFAAAENSLFSGFELFPGIKLDGVTIGATFSGWTQPTPGPEEWLPFSYSTGGFVSGSINYSGSPGFGKTVTIIGGSWSWLEADDHTIHSGPVLSHLNRSKSTVEWPANAQTDLGNVFGVDCGDGVATFRAFIRDSVNSIDGTISGCLNDQNPLIFPPQIWGRVKLPLAP